MLLEPGEADMLAAASVNVLDQFDIRPDPKIEAIFGLIIAAGTVYAPRYYLVRKRTAEERARQANAEEAGFNFNGTGAGITIDQPQVN